MLSALDASNADASDGDNLPGRPEDMQFSNKQEQFSGAVGKTSPPKWQTEGNASRKVEMGNASHLGFRPYSRLKLGVIHSNAAGALSLARR